MEWWRLRNREEGEADSLPASLPSLSIHLPSLREVPKETRMTPSGAASRMACEGVRKVER